MFFLGIKSFFCGLELAGVECLLRACEWTQTSLSNIIRHIYPRVQCESKQSSHRWSCCIRILSFRYVNKRAVTTTGCVDCSHVPFAFRPTFSPWSLIYYFFFRRMMKYSRDGWVFNHFSISRSMQNRFNGGDSLTSVRSWLVRSVTHSLYRWCKFNTECLQSKMRISLWATVWVLTSIKYTNEILL